MSRGSKVARSGMLAALDDRQRLQIAHPIQLQPAQDAANGGPAQPGLASDAEARPALPPQRLDPCDQLIRGRLAKPVRT